MKKKIGYEIMFSAKGQKQIWFKEYRLPQEKVVLSWNRGKTKKTFKGPNGILEADHFIKTTWPDYDVIWTNFRIPLTPRPAKLL